MAGRDKLFANIIHFFIKLFMTTVSSKLDESQTQGPGQGEGQVQSGMKVKIEDNFKDYSNGSATKGPGQI